MRPSALVNVSDVRDLHGLEGKGIDIRTAQGIHEGPITNGRVDSIFDTSNGSIIEDPGFKRRIIIEKNTLHRQSSGICRIQSSGHAPRGLEHCSSK